MQRPEPENNLLQSLARKACLLSGVLMAFWVSGCTGSTSSSTSTTSQQAPQTYFAPVVTGSVGVQTFTIDDEATTFSQETFALQLPEQVGPQVLNAGGFSVSQRGLRSLGISTTYIRNTTTGTYVPENYTPPETGSFAVELAGQAGGLVQMIGQPVTPLVAATQCPNFTSAQTYQFLTIPSAGWDPTADTAYGSVNIVSNGSAVTFQNIMQSPLPSVGGTVAQPSASSVTGACGSTTLGYITGVPGQYVVTDPGITPTGPAQAAIGIGPTGLLVENNGSGSVMVGTSPPIDYENVLGAGTGAVGLPEPSSPLASAPDTGAAVGAQYLGFIYAAGANSPSVPWSSHLASFGFSGYPTLPSACTTFAAQTGALVNGIYGGDFPQNNGQDNPSASPDGFGNCDFAIDLGTQSTSNNGLYNGPLTTVWIGANYAGNLTGTTYSFKAVAIAGQLNGKYAIFVLGVDSTQPWAIYLLQSN